MNRVPTCVKCNLPSSSALDIYELPCDHIIHRYCWDEVQRCPQCNASDSSISSSECSDHLKDELVSVLERGLPRIKSAVAEQPKVQFKKNVYINLSKASTSELHVNLIRLARTLEARVTAAEEAGGRLSSSVPAERPVTDATTVSLRKHLHGPPKYPFRKAKLPMPLKSRSVSSLSLISPPMVETTFQAWGPIEERVVLSDSEIKI